MSDNEKITGKDLPNQDEEKRIQDLENQQPEQSSPAEENVERPLENEVPTEAFPEEEAASREPSGDDVVAPSVENSSKQEEETSSIAPGEPEVSSEATGEPEAGDKKIEEEDSPSEDEVIDEPEDLPESKAKKDAQSELDDAVAEHS